MPYEVKLMQLSPSMDDGTVTRWLKKEGESIKQGEPLYEIESDKVSTAVESPAGGVLGKISVPEGEKVVVGTVLAIIAMPGEKLGSVSSAALAPPAAPMAQSPAAVSATPASTQPAERGERIFVSPRARRVAEEIGIDISSVTGTGPGGRILERDVVAAAKTAVLAPVAVPMAVAAPTPVAPAAYETVRLAGMRRTIAERMHRSKDVTAPVTLTAEVDMSEVAKLRAQINAEWERTVKLRVSYTDVIVRAVAKALTEHPKINASLVEQDIHLHKDVNVGVAVALEDGLIVPFVRNADKKSLMEINTAMRDLSERARAGKLTRDDVSGGTFTITNLGTYGVEAFTPIINYPECAILGIGRIGDRAVVRDGQVVVRPTMWLSLTFDHRIIDGAPAAEFLARVKALLESPYLLFV